MLSCPFAPKLAQFDASRCVTDTYGSLNRPLCNLVKETLEPYETCNTQSGSAFRLAIILIRALSRSRLSLKTSSIHRLKGWL